jgi:tetratricopeptide (TPR) repeat protein/S1-C subfamily serine protease
MRPGDKKYKSVALIATIGTILILPITYEISIATPKAISQQVTSEKSDEQLETLARSITVKVLSGENRGSGILIRKQDGVYTVLTNQHVIENGLPYQIQTADGKIFQAKTVTGVNFDSNDMALLQFSASQNYAVASLGNLNTVDVGSPVYVAGFPLEPDSLDANGFVFQIGKISFVLPKPLEEGYRIGYTTNVEKGMSGGPIFNSQGQVIGINGIFAQALSFSYPYIYEDGTRPNDDLEARMRRSSWGVPVDKLAQLAPQFVSGDMLAVEKPSAEPAAPQNRQLVEKIDGIAQQVSVLIARTNLDNGSGVIIAQEGNTYYVLTAGHVVSGKGMKIVTHDGQEYVVDSNKIKNWSESQGLDLALLEFTSNQSYQVAIIGDYPRGFEERVVFLSGWPASKQPTGGNLESDRRFNAGHLLGISGFNLAKDERSFTSGFGLVYGNLSEKGMSGGPVLDTEGRLIGIHTAAESVEGDTSPVLQKDSQETILEVGYSLGIPIRTFLDKLEQEKIKLNINQHTSSPRRLDPVAQDLVISSLINLQQPQSNAAAVEWLNYGNKLWRLRRYKKSLQAFEQAILIEPNFYLAQYSHGWTLIRQKEYPEAIESLTKAIKYAKSLPESEYKPRALSQAWRQISDAHFYSGQYKESLQTLEKAIEYTPKDFILYQWKTEILRQLGLYQEALEAVNKAIKMNPDNSFGYFRRASIRLDLENSEKATWEEKDYEEAIADINKALELNPGNILYYSYIGNIYTWKEDYAKAIEYFTKAIEAEPDFAKVYAMRGLVYAKQGNRQKFTEDLERALRLQPDNGELYQYRGNGYFALKEKQKGIDDFDKAISLDPESVHKYYNSRGFGLNVTRGDAYFQIGEKQKGIDDYDKAISLDPESAHKYYNLRGVELNKLEDYEGALRDYNKAIELTPDNALYYSHRGDAYFQIGEKQKGIDDYDKAINLNRESAHKYYNWRGVELNKLEDYEGALRDYNKAIELTPDNALYYSNRGDAYFQIGEKQKGIDDYDKAISLDPESAHKYYNWRGVELNKLEDYEGALRDYNKAIELTPDNALYYSHRGDAYFQIGEKQKGIDDYDKAISLDPESAHKYYNRRGVKLYKLEDYEGALRDINKPIELTPDNALYYSNRGDAYFQIGEKQKGIDDYDKAISLDPESAHKYYNLRGVNLYNLEDYEGVLRDYNKAIELTPDNAFYYVTRGYAYLKIGNNQKAREDFNKAANLYQKQGNTKKYQRAMEQLEKIQEQE